MAEQVDTDTGEIIEDETNFEMAATKVGVNLITALIDELKMIKDPSNSARSLWQSLDEKQLDEIVGRLSNRIQYEVRIGYGAILSGGVPGVTAALDKVVFSEKGIEGKLIIPRHTDYRHDLADFAGSQVVVVMAQDISGYFEDMDSIIIPPDQMALDINDDAATDPEA